jgi:L-rhamnose mutarotase
MDTTDEFSLEQKAADDLKNSKVQEWERLMWRYQQAIPGSRAGEKWRLMDMIFDLSVNG